MSDAGTGGAPAGWYEDGVTAGQQRYWDGTQWTDQFRPLAPPEPVAPPAEPAAPAAPAATEAAAAETAPAYTPAAGTAPAYPPASPQAAAPVGGAYPDYQPAAAPPARAAGKGLSKGAIIGIIAGAAAVIVAIVLILGFTVWGWAGGGGTSNVQQATYLSNVKSMTGSTSSDQDLLAAGQTMCDAGRQIVDGDYLGGSMKYLELLDGKLDIVALGAVGQYAMSDLCPDVNQKLMEMGESFEF